MPLSIILVIVGIVLICAAYYLVMPPPLKSLCMFGGVACVAVGLVLLLVALVSAGHIGMLLLGG